MPMRCWPEAMRDMLGCQRDMAPPRPCGGLRTPPPPLPLLPAELC